MRNEKTVYIFGAGASVAAGLPIQNQLLIKIFSSFDSMLKQITSGSILDPENDFSFMLLSQYDIFKESRRGLAEFIIKNFGSKALICEFEKVFPINRLKYDLYSDEDKWIDFYCKIKEIDVSLEDLFTLLDKASLQKEYFGDYSAQDINDIQQRLNNCIVYTISSSMQNAIDNSLYNKIADFFVSNRLKTAQRDDPFSIITLNWDTLLDYYINRSCIQNTTGLKNIQICPDYCCYNNDINSGIPSIHAKAIGKYNIKLMKLHGSINWLLCANCGRLYTDFNHNISLQGMGCNNKSIRCIHCENAGRNYSLNHLLVTPTFLKTFNTLHLKSIWHNAYLDLCEATEINFIGYSFPDADFELRYTLKKAIRPDTKIKVILHISDDKNTYMNCIKKNCSTSLRNSLISRINVPYNRYKSFFNNHDIDFNYNGIENAF